MAQVVTYSIDTQPVDQGLRNAFEFFAQEQAMYCALVISPGIQLNLEIIEPIAELINESLIVHLALVHPSPNLGFVVSSIALRATRAKISSFTNAEDVGDILKSKRRSTLT